MSKKDHKSAELARLFYRELTNVQGNDAWADSAKTEALARLLDQLFLEVTKDEHIHFTTAFARTAYACHKFQVDKKTQYWVHFFRKKIRGPLPEAEVPEVCALGLKTVAACIEGLFGGPPPEEVRAFLPKKTSYTYKEVKVKEFRRRARVLALSDDAANDLLLARDEENPALAVHVQYNIAERNEPFNPTIRHIRQTFGFPVMLSLIDVEVTERESQQSDAPTTVYRPRAIVVEPDYLLDVSTVANCFQGSSTEPVTYLLQKFLPSEPSQPMILGNIANFFLDELMHNPDAVFKDTFPKVFKTTPLTFALLPDAAIRQIYEDSKKHWTTLQMMVRQEMKKFDINPAECYLEPSFYDETHGLQGRLDVFYKNENRSAIIELKSGKPFMPNRYGIGASHYIQTLLYDLMVRSVFGEEVAPACYILYSGLDSRQLKYAPLVKAEQNEALQVRNQLVAIDRRLAAIRGHVGSVPVLEKITTARFPHLKGFHLRDVELFEKTYHALGDTERRYFNAFAGLIAREHLLAKTGVQGADKANGLAALWLDTFEEKEAGFHIIKSLKIKENRAFDDDALIVFEKTAATNPLANFRAGDIAVLYPMHNVDSERPSPIKTQIFKVTVLGITPGAVTVRLRYKQFNLQIFCEFEEWNLEHDQMDMGFTAMYQGLFRWAQADARKRDLLLTARPPDHPVTDNLPGLPPPAGDPAQPMTAEQHAILLKMLAARDYFLLWGPPGTGKTSVMLKHFAGWIFKNTDENLLLLAYTNRAVDEICEALESLGDEVKDAYLRIGSRYSTGEGFEDQLLASKTAHANNRKELLDVLGRHRIFVSTLASLSNNLQLLKLKRFRRIVIDEASQILEPALVGLLPQFEQFILIGDHKQLPAVVVQDVADSAVEDEKLNDIGLYNLRNSLFERLYRRCTAAGWDWACGHLSHQGRMHQEIMRFPGEHFYEGKLKILPPELSISQKQVAGLPAWQAEGLQPWEAVVVKKRLVFLSTPVDRKSTSRKTNRFEAELIAGLVRFFQKNNQNGLEAGEGGQPKSIGIITPYRAQIAQMQEALQQAGIPLDGLTIDTVERYQGGARDIILISLCTNAASQMETLVSLSEEGVDRKLNVALTRAREHVVVLGNEELLAGNEVYRKLLAYCRE